MSSDAASGLVGRRCWTDRVPAGAVGFTLIELLVVMVIIGALAAIAIPSYLTVRGKAQETTVKSDIKQIAKEVVGFYIDGTGALSVTNSADGKSWRLLDAGGAEIAIGPLSQRNSVVTSGIISSDNDYCISILPDYGNARAWKATPSGLESGSC